MRSRILIITLVTVMVTTGCGCKDRMEQYKQDIKLWEGELKDRYGEGAQLGNSGGEQVTVTVMEEEDHPYVRGLRSYFCLAIDGRIVFEGEINGPKPKETFIGIMSHTTLVEGILLTKGKHTFDAIDVARGYKLRQEVTITDGPCWVVITSQSESRTLIIRVERRPPAYL